MNKSKLYLGISLISILLLPFSCKKKEEPVINTDRVQEICQRVAEVTSISESICLECETYDEMYARMDEIASLEGVSKVYGNNDVIYVKIDGWGTIGYSFCSSDEEINATSSFNQYLNQHPGVRSSELDDTISNTRKACIMNAQYQEREWTHGIVDQTEKLFESCGFSCQIVNYPTPYFYRNEIFQYDLVFIIGHGGYDSDENLHWLETSEYFIPAKWNEQTSLPLAFSFPEDEIMGRFDRYKVMGVGNLFHVYQYYISEKFILNSPNRFQEDGEAVLFMVPCQSLKGDSTTDHDKPIDRALADAFFDRGAGLYIGYDESSCSNAQKGGMLFYGQLLSGVSYERAINNLPSTYRNHTHTREVDGKESVYDVAMHVLTSSEFDLSSHLTSPVFLSFDSGSEKGYALRGASFYCSPGSLRLHYNSLNTERFDYAFLQEDSVQYGFCISETVNRSAGKKYVATPTWDHDVTQDSYLMTFELDIPIKSLKPDTKYYAWPYMADGSDYNYGDRFEFSTNRIAQVIPEEILDQMDDYIPIYGGVNPPNIEGQFLMSKMELVHTTHGYQPGDIFADTYIQFYNQNMNNNTLDYRDEQVSYNYNTGSGAFISGEENDFSVFFNTYGTSYHEDYNVDTKMALVVSGTKTDKGIKDMTYAFVMVDKSDDPKGYIVPINTFRVFRDKDGLSVPTSHFKSPSSAPMKSLPYNPTNSSLLPSNLDTIRN